MKIRRFARFFGIVGVVFLVFGGLSGVLLAYDEFHFVPIHLILGLIFLVLFVLGGGLHILTSAASKKATTFGFNTTIYTAFFLGILIVGNYIASRHSFLNYDSTEQKAFTLAPQTLKVLATLQKPVVVRAFYKSGVVDTEVSELLTRMTKENSNFTWDVVDIEREPSVVELYEIKEPQTLHFAFQEEPSGRVARVSGKNSEEDVVNALLKLTRGGEKVVYCLAGHGERDTGNTEDSGYSFIKEAIEGENLKVRELHLEAEQQIPADAATILILAPAKSFLPYEEKAILDYLHNGGTAVFMTEPHVTNSLSAIAREFGIEIGNDIVVDEVVRLFEGPGLGVQPLVTEYGDHPITEDFNQNTVFSTTSSVRAIEADSKDVIELVKTSPKSWAETKLDLIFGEKPEAVMDPEDTPGPVSIAAVYEAPLKNGEKSEIPDPDPSSQSASDAKRTRLVVVGDTDWAANVNLGVLFNRDLFLNMVNWAVGESVLAIRPRAFRQSVKGITMEQFSSIFLVGAILLPELLILVGFGVWWFRRTP